MSNLRIHPYYPFTVDSRIEDGLIVLTIQAPSEMVHCLEAALSNLLGLGSKMRQHYENAEREQRIEQENNDWQARMNHLRSTYAALRQAGLKHRAATRELMQTTDCVISGWTLAEYYKIVKPYQTLRPVKV